MSMSNDIKTTIANIPKLSLDEKAELLVNIFEDLEWDEFEIEESCGTYDTAEAKRQMEVYSR